MSPAVLESFALFSQQLVNGLALGSLYALIAVGLTLFYGVVRLVDLAHGEVCRLGFFIVLSLLSGFFSVTLPFVPAVVAAVCGCALAGFFLDLVFFRPLRRAPGLAGLVTAIGIAFILQSLVLLFRSAGGGFEAPAGVPGWLYQPALELGGVVISWLQVLIPASLAFVLSGLELLFRHTRFGRGVRALGEDRTAALLVGVEVDRMVSLVFALGSGIGGLAGILAGLYGNLLGPTTSWTLVIKGLAAALLGGLGSLPGALLGGGILGLAEIFGAGYISSAYRDGIVWALLILILLLRPQGLLGKSLPGREGLRTAGSRAGFF
jgi:branched-chain amino acid transport system permease protein